MDCSPPEAIRTRSDQDHLKPAKSRDRAGIAPDIRLGMRLLASVHLTERPQCRISSAENKIAACIQRSSVPKKIKGGRPICTSPGLAMRPASVSNSSAGGLPRSRLAPTPSTRWNCKHDPLYVQSTPGVQNAVSYTCSESAFHSAWCIVTQLAKVHEPY